MANKSFENVCKVRVTSNLLSVENYEQTDLEKRCYHEVQNILSSRPLSVSIKIKIRYTRLQFYPLFCVGVKPGFLH